jgi:hypothetical protein
MFFRNVLYLLPIMPCTPEGTAARTTNLTWYYALICSVSLEAAISRRFECNLLALLLWLLHLCHNPTLLFEFN